MAEPVALPASALRTYCDPACFTFDTTESLDDPSGGHAGDPQRARAPIGSHAGSMIAGLSRASR